MRKTPHRKRARHYEEPGTLHELTFSRYRRLPLLRQRPGVSRFRYWQEGPGYDRNLSEPRTLLAAIDYLHANPVRRGLVQAAIDWRWSRVRHYCQETLPADPLLPKVHGLPAGWE